MTVPVNSSSADVYTDFAGLTALKKDVRANDPNALRQVAKQYESLFARMMIKSMRDAVGKDPMFGSDEGQTYQEMYDDQLSIEMTKGRGLGLADMLVRQLQKISGGGQTDDAKDAKGASASAGAAAITPQMGAKAALRTSLRKFQGDPQGNRNGGSSGDAVAPVASPQARASFINDLWPTAQAAGQQLGVDPRNLIAQAALETNWGTRVPRDSQGRSTNNLFGVKAGGQWNGASVTAATQEYQSGAAFSTNGQFRAYDSREQSFQDYVTLLRSSPRYASKVAAIATAVDSRSATLEPSFKSASAVPLNPNTGVL
jgi:flagellar protein FlgJ